MGNRFSKKAPKPTSWASNYYELFSTYKYETKGDFDEKEHLVHVVIREIFKGNFSSPIQDILSDPDAKILDVGCGSGFWVIEMAADYSKPSYIGLDKLPLFPKSTFPSNVQFLQHDLSEGLPFEDNTFEFVHIQALGSEFTEPEWESFVYKELARVLKPGGWLEICDPEFEMTNCGPTLKQLNLTVCNGLMSRNLNPQMAKRHQSLIKSTLSFSPTVLHDKGYLQLGCYTNKIGKIGTLLCKEHCRYAYQGPLGKMMKVQPKDVNNLVDKIEIECELYKPYYFIHRICVQKKE
ncbi:S-adenosyl-L-methionine-dependent methyltransferase [Glomus cerebriforme]|uniref:S-adenosyl-L-methionine-dependent methyltransferase n=1 Tax=Glomus cerebriforme TaxID=658196 RepID=A0A397TP47_9GLOM|nr:S-adenosyl-L-methionine-dependent methyltransferase [Glomus cerebriforme]